MSSPTDLAALQELVAEWRRELCEVDSDRDNYSPPSADKFADELEATLSRLLEAQAGVPEGWQHIANEWADVATNGIQWLKNVRDGVNSFDEAIADMQRNIEQVRALPHPPSEGEQT